MTTADVDAARRAVRYYRKHGWQAVPTTPEKHPVVCYADYWESPAPAWWWTHREASCVQLMTGSKWGLAVVDLDGPAALIAWRFLCRDHEPFTTWESDHGPRGRHIWFRLPDDIGPLDRARVVWKGTGKHSQIEVLGDHALVMSPPSYHRDGSRYLFRDGHSPRDIEAPAGVPQWLLDLPSVVTRPSIQSSMTVYSMAVYPRRPCRSPRRDRWAVLDRIADKVGVAHELGLRFAGRRMASGWWPCHAIDREDRNPSAQFSENTGYYCEPAAGIRMSLFDLASALKPGVFPTWQHALDQFARDFGASVENPRIMSHTAC